jgi:hypothetical protein
MFPQPIPRAQVTVTAKPGEGTLALEQGKFEASVELQFTEVVVFGWRLVAPRHPGQGLLLLAMFGGILGSFMHAAQSFSIYVGNRQFLASWILWYVLRPPVGAVLGMLFFLVVRAGLLTASTESVSPYGVVAFGALAGWFSKQATDKLAELFETLFRTEKAQVYRDKLSERPRAPRIDKVTPAGSSGVEATLAVEGENFTAGARVALDGVEYPTRINSSRLLMAVVPAGRLPVSGAEVRIVVVDPDSAKTPSEPYTLRGPSVSGDGTG